MKEIWLHPQSISQTKNQCCCHYQSWKRRVHKQTWIALYLNKNMVLYTLMLGSVFVCSSQKHYLEHPQKTTNRKVEKDCSAQVLKNWGSYKGFYYYYYYFYSSMIGRKEHNKSSLEAKHFFPNHLSKKLQSSYLSNLNCLVSMSTWLGTTLFLGK